jgi:hypothetical protein
LETRERTAGLRAANAILYDVVTAGLQHILDFSTAVAPMAPVTVVPSAPVMLTVVSPAVTPIVILVVDVLLSHKSVVLDFAVVIVGSVSVPARRPVRSASVADPVLVPPTIAFATAIVVAAVAVHPPRVPALG